MEKIKRLFAGVLATLLIFSLIPVRKTVALADTPFLVTDSYIEGVKYSFTVAGENQATLTGIVNLNSSVYPDSSYYPADCNVPATVISGGKEYTVVGVTGSTFAQDCFTGTLTIPASIQSISDGVFANTAFSTIINHSSTLTMNASCFTAANHIENSQGYTYVKDGETQPSDTIGQGTYYWKFCPSHTELSLNSETQVDSSEEALWYSFTPAESGRYVFSIDYPEDDTDEDGVYNVDLELFNSSGYPMLFTPAVTHDDYGLEEYYGIACVLTAGTTYYIETYSTESASYGLTVNRDPNWETVTSSPIALEEDTQVPFTALSQHQYQTYEISVSVEGHYRLSLNSSVPIKGYLYSVHGNGVNCYNYDGEPEDGNYNFEPWLSAGDYYFVVEVSEPGTVMIEAQDIDGYSTAMVAGRSYTTEESSGASYYKFSPVETATYIISGKNLSNTTFCVEMGELIDDGVEWDDEWYIDSYRDFNASFTGMVGNSYYIVIYPKDDDTGSFSISMNKAENNVEVPVNNDVIPANNTVVSNPTPTTVGVTGVSVNSTSQLVSAGTSFQLVPTVSPANATNKNVVYMSSDTSVAVVTSTGVVKAIAPGTAVITVTTEDGNHKANCTVNVPGMTLNDSVLILKKGKTSKAIKVNLINDKVASVKSSNTKVATVKRTGNALAIKGVKKGKATITVTSSSGIKKEIKVQVQTGKVTTKQIKLSKSSVTLAKKGKSVVVSAKATPDKVSTGEKITVSVSNKKIVTAKVSADGKITIKAKKKGSCKVIVKAGKIKKEIKVKVKK